VLPESHTLRPGRIPVGSTGIQMYSFRFLIEREKNTFFSMLWTPNLQNSPKIIKNKMKTPNGAIK
jgi:hypothetical protein